MPSPAKSVESQSALYVFNPQRSLIPSRGEISGLLPHPPPQVLPDCAHNCFSTPGTPGTSLKEIRRVCGGLMGSWKVPGLSHWRWKPVVSCCLCDAEQPLRIPSAKQMQSSHLEGLLWGSNGMNPWAPTSFPFPTPPLTACLPALDSGGEMVFLLLPGWVT